MGKRKRKKLEVLADEAVNEAFGLPTDPVGSEEDARTLVLVGVSDVVRALLELLDSKTWEEKAERADEASAALDEVIDKCDEMLELPQK